LLPKDPTGTHPVIDVHSLMSIIKKVESSGGKTVMPKMEVGNFGLYARVKYTEGNINWYLANTWELLVTDLHSFLF